MIRTIIEYVLYACCFLALWKLAYSEGYAKGKIDTENRDIMDKAAQRYRDEARLRGVNINPPPTYPRPKPPKNPPPPANKWPW